MLEVWIIKLRDFSRIKLEKGTLKKLRHDGK